MPHHHVMWRISLVLLLCCAAGVTAAQDTDSSDVEEIVDLEFVEEVVQPDATESDRLEQLMDLVGRFHPAVVHFPIAWLILFMLVETVAMANGAAVWSNMGKLLLVLTVISFIPAIGSGLLRASRIGGDADFQALMSLHRNLNIAAVVLCLIAGILRFKIQNFPTGTLRVVYITVIALSCGLVMLAGHLGGKMVFGSNYLPF